MTPEQIQLVRLSFVKVMNIKAQIGRRFYQRLFAIAPDVRRMFKGDMESQERKLMDSLAFAIGSLRRPAIMTDMLSGLAKRHLGYGVRDEHYEKVREALLWALEKELGADFSSEVKTAWAALYDTVAGAMKQAAPVPKTARA